MSLRTVNRTLTLLSRLIDPKKSTTPMVLTVPQKPPCHRLSVAQPFLRVTPESQGISSDTVAEFLRELAADRSLNMHSVLLLRGGKVLAQAVFGAQDPQLWKMTFSACKSIVSLAIGLLVDEGKLSTDTRVVELFPDKTTPVSRLKYKELTVRHLLTMTSGATFNEAAAMTETDWLSAFFVNAPSTKPGREFRYNSLNTYLLSAIVCRVSGESLCEFLKPRLFAPLGITDYFWETCPDGIEKGGWGLYIGSEDLAKIGQLVLNGGVWNGKQLISRAWLEAATTRAVATSESLGDFDYGYQIWCGREKNRFLFNGMLGQNVLAFPESGILLVTNAGNDELFQQSRYFALAEQYFGGEFADVLPENELAVQNLAETIRAISGQKTVPPLPWWKRWLAPKKGTLPELCYRLNGVSLTTDAAEAASTGLLPLVLQLVQNNYTTGLQGVSFSVEKDTFWVTYTENEDIHRFPVGFGTAADGEVYFRGEPYRIRTTGRVAKNEDDADVLMLNIAFVETPCTRHVRVYFEEDGVRLWQTERPGQPLMALFRSELRHKLEEQPVVGSAMEKLDDDYITYRINRLFVPELPLNKA
ncbi:MAG: serine hydrolase [Clostridia bacterium]|nr:serine hydrolase [Clostridia bacterium]